MPNETAPPYLCKVRYLDHEKIRNHGHNFAYGGGRNRHYRRAGILD